MSQTFRPHGQHLILDLYGVPAPKLIAPDVIEGIMLHIAHELKATVINSHLHHFGENMGVTGVLLLAESHMSIHTWPEDGFAAIDLFMCGDVDIAHAITLFVEFFTPTSHQTQTLQRGHAGSHA